MKKVQSQGPWGVVERYRDDLNADEVCDKRATSQSSTGTRYRDTKEDVTNVECERGSMWMLVACEGGRLMRSRRRTDGE